MCLHNCTTIWVKTKSKKVIKILFFFICTALPDEQLKAVFRPFSLKEIVGTLSKVSKRWCNILQTDGLWHSLPATVRLRGDSGQIQ